MNYGLRYSLALIIGFILAFLWVWLFVSNYHPAFSFMPFIQKSIGGGFEFFFSYVDLIFYAPHIIILCYCAKTLFKKNGRNIFLFIRPLILRIFSRVELLISKYIEPIDKEESEESEEIFFALPFFLLIFIGGWVFFASFLGCLAIVVAAFYAWLKNPYQTTSIVYEIIWKYAISLAIPFLLLRFPPIYVRLKEEISTHPRYRRWFSFSKGGSARWAGIRSYRKHYFPDANDFNDGVIYFGKTLFEDTFWSNDIAIKDDAHLLTVGCTGSGKSATALWSNLAMYEGSMLIIDPKGEHAKKTFWRRTTKENLPENKELKTKFHLWNSQAILLDPFNYISDLPKSSYNPLSDIDIESDHARKLLSYISDACVLQEDARNQHFVDTASLLLEGVIAHVLSQFPKENHNLPFICDLLIGLDSEIGVADPEKFENLLIEMRMNGVAGGIAQMAASRLDEMGGNERGSVLSTLARSVKWITDPPMRKHLSESDFSLNILIEENKVHTVYVVLPFDYMKEQARWLRVITNVALGLIQTASEPPSPPIVFVLDEFPMMGGKLKRIEEGIVTLRSAGVKLWLLVQNIGQLKRDYDKNWETFVSSSTVQLFGVKDLETAQWASEMLGDFMSVRTEKTGWVKKRVMSEDARKLATSPEIMEELGKSSPMQFVFPMAGLPMRLQRLAYKPLEIDGNHFKGLPLEGHFEE